MRQALVTGGAGFIGSHMAERVLRDGWAPLRRQSPYATAKAAGERYCLNFCELYGLETSDA